MSPEARNSQLIDAPIDAMGEIVTTTVNRLGWRIKFVNPRLRQLSAFDNTTDTIKRVTWRYEYDLFLKWKKTEDGVLVDISVSERRNKWTNQKCQERCRDILRGIASDAADLREHLEEEAQDEARSGKWATFESLLEAGYITDRGDHRRLILGPAPGGQHISVPAPETAMHSIVCGPTGCGKTSTVYIPNLIERIGVSAIVTEATAGDELPDLFKKTAGFRAMAGHKIYKFNPDDLSSTRINPLEMVRTYDNALDIANLIIENTSSEYTKDAKIWEDSERQLLTNLVLHAVSEGKTLGDIRAWLRKGPEQLGQILMDSDIDVAKEEYWGFYKSSTEGFRNGVVSGLMQRLNLWVSPRIVALTETTDLDVEALQNELFTFYFAIPAHKGNLKPLAALAFNFIFQLVLSRQFSRPVALFLDEFTNYGHIPGLADAMSIIRHRNIPAMLGFQDYVQLKKVYGPDNADLLFGQPATAFIFRPRENKTARMIAETLGSKTVRERKVTSSGQIVEREFEKPLMKVGDVRALEKGHAIVFTPSTNPILLRTFHWKDFVEATKYDPPHFETLQIDEDLIEQCNQMRRKPGWQKKFDRDRRGKAAGDKKGGPQEERNRNQRSGGKKRTQDNQSRQKKQQKQQQKPQPVNQEVENERRDDDREDRYGMPSDMV